MTRSLEPSHFNQETNTSSCRSESQHPSVLSSIEGIALTPPATPSPTKLAQLLETDQCLMEKPLAAKAVTSWADNVFASADDITRKLSSSTISSIATSVEPCRRRSHSVSNVESALHRIEDPFNTDWSLWTDNSFVFASRNHDIQQIKKKTNTNPFIPSSPETCEKNET